MNPALKAVAAPVNAGGEEALDAFVVTVPLEVDVGIGVEVAPTSEVVVCFGVGKLRVALRELNRALACAELVALRETVVTAVTWDEVTAVDE
jgi:hypothetical protein